MKNIILNADDFGLTEQIDSSIIALCEKGAVSSVSVLAAGRSFARDVGALGRFPGAGKGIHLCLTDEQSVLGRDAVPTLTDAHGRFLAYPGLIARLFLGTLSAREVYLEWKAQIEKLLAAGITPTHLDTHQHLHLFPFFFRIAVHLAEEYDIPAMRSLRHGRLAECGLSPRNWAKYILSRTYGNRDRELRERGIATADTVLGFLYNGNMSKQALRRYIGAARDGETTEIICHCGYAQRRPTDGFDLSSVVSEAKGIQLVGYRDTAVQAKAAVTGAGHRAPQSLSIVFPAYNEYENIQKTLKIALRFMERHVKDYEIIVVDDGSTDGTGEAARSLIAGRGGTVVRNDTRKGRGRALKAGLERASKEWIFYCDADYPVNIDKLITAFGYIDSCDIIIGRRINPAYNGFFRYLYSVIYQRSIQFLFGLTVHHPNFAFKLMRKSALDLRSVRSESSFFDVELLVRAKEKGGKIQELPVFTLSRTFGRSYLNNLSNFSDSVRDMVRYYLSRGRSSR